MSPTSVQTLPSLAAGRSTESALRLGLNAPRALLAGEYVYRVTYVSRAGWPAIYDVYERGADEVWEGELTALKAVQVTTICPVEWSCRARRSQPPPKGRREP